jgi:hypothetical protein
MRTTRKMMKMVAYGMLICALSMSAMEVTAKVIHPRNKATTPTKELKAAYKYRTDIAKDVLAITKKWPDKYGVLHNDWIENLNGRSIDLQGREILSWLDYTNLELCCDTFFVATNEKGKKGVFGRQSEKCLASVSYDEIDFSYTALTGTFIAKMGNDATKVTAVFSTTGEKFDFLEITKLVGVFYYPKSNIISIIWTDSSDNTHKSFYWPNGKRAYGEDIGKGELTLGTDGFKYTPPGDTVPQTLKYINTEVSCPRPRVLTKEQMTSQDNKSFKSNKWIELADQYNNTKNYRDMAFCYD